MKLELQSEAGECGLACLAMVASHHGLGIGLRELRNRHGLSLKGASLARLMDIASALGFRCRPLRLELGDLRRLQTPCILHWDFNHFVVLAKAGRSRITLLDPATGKRAVDLAEASQRFTGVALELSPGEGFQPCARAPAVSLRQLTGRIAGARRSLALLLLLSVVLQGFTILAPFYMQWVVDQVLVSADRDLLTVLGIGFGLVLLLQAGTGLLRGWTVVYLSSRLGLQWTGNVFAHLLKLPMAFFERRHLGDIVSRMGSVQAIQKTLTTSFVEALIDGMMAVATLAMMLAYSWKLALATLVAVAVYLALRAAAFQPLRRGTERQLVAAARQQGHLLESLRGMQSIKVAGVERHRESAYSNLMHATVDRDAWLALLGIGFGSANKLVFGVERIAVVWIGALLALQGTFSAGMLIAYLSYKDQFATRVAGLIDKWIDFRMLRLHGERLADIVLATPQARPDPACGAGTAVATTQDVAGEGALVVERLSFRYAEGEPWVLRDCSFEVAPGESVAIVGASGCGKTTLLKVMLGLLDPGAGSVSLAGRHMHGGDAGARMATVGAVMQDDHLFAGSLAENIALGDDAPDLRRVEAAARLASIHDEIAAMPMGYQSLIGDMGTTLSGGQKQRVVLARALYRRPKVLFLDEATSHLDALRERSVNEAIRHLRMTRIIVAHRAETIASADRVLVMDGGRIVQDLRQPAAEAA